MATQLWHRVTVAGGTTLADAAEVGAQLIPSQAPRFFPGTVQTRGQPALVTRRLFATARTTVQGVSFYWQNESQMSVQFTGFVTKALHRCGFLKHSTVSQHARLYKLEEVGLFCLGTDTAIKGCNLVNIFE
jgi:hypothetical protein